MAVHAVVKRDQNIFVATLRLRANAPRIGVKDIRLLDFVEFTAAA